MEILVNNKSLDAQTIVIVVGVLIGLGLWWFSAGQPGAAPRSGSYSCLTAERFEHKQRAHESGVPFMYDPRESQWAVTLSSGEVSEVSEFRQQKSGEIAAVPITEGLSAIEKLNPTSFTMTIEGTAVGCELSN